MPFGNAERIWMLHEYAEKYDTLLAENERLKAEIERIAPKHGHDHECFHDDCGLCQLEKEMLDERQKRLKGE